MEILYFTFHLKFVNSQLAAMFKCPDYVWRGIEPSEILSTRQAAQ